MRPAARPSPARPAIRSVAAPLACAVGLALIACAEPRAQTDPTPLRPALGRIDGERCGGTEAWTLLGDIESALVRAGFDVKIRSGTLIATRPGVVREGEHRVRIVDPRSGDDPLEIYNRPPPDPDRSPELRTTFVPAGEFEHAEISTVARVHIRATKNGRILGIRHEVETDPPGYLFHPEVGYGISPVEAFWEAYKPVVLGGPGQARNGNANAGDGEV